MPSGGGSIGPQAMAVLRQVHKSRKLNQDLESAISALKKEAGEEADLTFLEEEDVPSLIAALDKTCHAPAGDNVGTLRSTLKSRYKDADDDELQLFEDDNYQTVHPLSGRPVQWESQVKMLLLAGFPLDHSFVQAKLQRIREALVKKDQESRCPVPRSRHAFVVADHTGILKPNEIFYQSSVSLFSRAVSIIPS